jgi:integrase
MRLNARIMNNDETTARQPAFTAEFSPSENKKVEGPVDTGSRDSHLIALKVDLLTTKPAEAKITPNFKILPKTTYKFTKGKDSRGREVPGLWVRNGRYYYQLSIPGKGCRRVPLVDETNQAVKNVAAAADAIHELRKRKKEGELPGSRPAPAFNEYVERYLAWITDTNKKKPKTIWQERSVLKGWARFLGSIKLTEITRQHINDYVLKRKKQGVGNRTVNVDVLVLSNCLKFAKEEDGLLPFKLPTEGWKALDYKAPKRPLFTRAQFEHLCAVAVEKNPDGTPKYLNGEMLADAIRFMLFCGARVSSALATKWSDVNWERRQVHLRKTKYSKNNINVDFNADLEAHLKDMYSRRLPDRDYLFPGTRTEENVGSLRKTFELVRAAAGLTELHFHDTRHAFISTCVACGVDLVTIAGWVGHEDSSLISRVYAHLSNEVAQRAARKVSFGAHEVKPQLTAPDLSKLTVADLLKLVEHAKGNAVS